MFYVVLKTKNLVLRRLHEKLHVIVFVEERLIANYNGRIFLLVFLMLYHKILDVPKTNMKTSSFI